MNQKELSNQLGITPEHLSRIMTGKAAPSRKLALRLEEVTSIQAAIWILGSPTEKRDAWRRFRATQQ